MIKKIIKKAKLGDSYLEKADVSFWLSKPPKKRIEAVEILRRQYNGSSTRLQKVIKVIQHS